MSKQTLMQYLKLIEERRRRRLERVLRWRTTCV